MKHLHYTTYLFDFDYTLADSSQGIVKCFRIVLEANGYMDITDEDIKRTIGKTLENSFSILTGVKDEDTLEEYRQAYSNEANHYMTINTFLFNDAKETLIQLKNQGAKLGIISTKYRYRIIEFLNTQFPTDFFDIIIGGEDVKHHKPSPEGLLKAIELLNVNKSEVLYLGDSIVDAETGQAASVDFAGVLNGMTSQQELEAYPHKMMLSELSQLTNTNATEKGEVKKKSTH